MRALTLLFCSLLFLPSLAVEPESNRQKENIIEVTGEGRISLPQDKIKIDLLLTDESRHISKAKMFIEQQSKQIKQMAAGLGISPDSIRWQQVHVRPLYKEDSVQLHALEVPHSLPQGDEARVFISQLSADKTSEVEKFELSRRISIDFSDAELYQQFLQRVIGLGVKNIFPALISSDEYQQYYQQALDLAVSDAKAKAARLAQQTGTRLGGLSSLREVVLPGNKPGQEFDLSLRRENFTPLAQEIRARVVVSFRIIP
ncbi:SIMPL domain-containing protein [Thalassomonas viridans]|uniref:SIMPL domain-containing protein n=1 Tax=Thalassomonas viridans TaxID=137584 RepID=A0AAE9Z6R0_9GAMM|nr:SIMPL domain-containing protein [Thalassomonas viridans]WDE07638.1 SIMPL domain-containing protein [Thalassomonas viridans]